MGQSSSSARRRRRYTTDVSSSSTTNNYSSSSFPSPSPLNQSPPPPPPPPPPPSSSNYPYYTPNPYNYPPPNPNYYYSNSNSYPPPSYQHQLTQTVNSVVTFIESLITSTTSSGTGSRPNNNSYHNNYGPPSNQFTGPWAPSQPPLGPPPPPPPPMQQHQPPPQFVESQNAKTVKNEVNVHKDTIRFTPDESNDQHLLTFTFDASVDGSITIYYFAREEKEGSCIFSTVYPDIYKPTKFSFQKGPGQTFSQPSGSGINLSFFALEDLSKPLKENIFPLVICIKNEEATCAQITEAIIEKTNNGSFQPKVKKQILLVNGERYELQEIYGLANSEDQADSNDDGDGDDRGKECVICLSEPRNTAVFPCRHMCMCSDCAKALRTQSNKCPICRQPVEKLMEIKVNKGNC